MKKWHYIEHKLEPSNIIRSWVIWLIENVGYNGNGWKWDDNNGHYFICFTQKEDATAFKLRFNI